MMETTTAEALREAQTPPVLHAPYPPKTYTTLHLYDEAVPTSRLSEGSRPHVAVMVSAPGMGVAVACWTPATLRRFASVCMAAADQLDDALAAGQVSA